MTTLKHITKWKGAKPKVTYRETVQLIEFHKINKLLETDKIKSVGGNKNPFSTPNEPVEFPANCFCFKCTTSYVSMPMCHAWLHLSCCVKIMLLT